MSDRARGYFPVKASLAASLAGGAVSGLLYSSLFLSIAFLVPVQTIFGRLGMSAGLLAAGTSVVAIAIGLALRMIQMGALEPVYFFIGLVPPLLFLAALALMNARWWKGKLGSFRIILPSALIALIALPALVILSSDQALVQRIEQWLGELVSAMEGSGYGSSILGTSDSATFVERLISALNNSYAAYIFMFLGLSWMIGNRLAGPDSPGRLLAGPIEEYKLPFAAVWAFLGAWTAALAVAMLRPGALPAAIAWNLAYAAAMAYAVQGFGIATFYLKRRNAPRALRIVLAAACVLALFTSGPSALILAIVFTLLGVTETWIPYRNLKESEHESNT